MKKIFRVVQTDNNNFPPVLGRKDRKDFNCRLKVSKARTEEETLRSCCRAHLVLATRGIFSRRVLEAMTDCIAIIRFGVGVENIDLAAATDAGIIVANVPDFCAGEVADTVAAFILALNRKLFTLHRTVVEGKWDRRLARPIHRLKGKTLGLIGFGRIARAVADRMKGFGLKIIVYDPYLNKKGLKGYPVSPVSQDSLLKRSDFISLHVPLNKGTYHLLGEKQFSKIKRGAYLINTSRGKIIDETALLKALKTGRLSGAALDVLENEPPDRGNLLLGLNNVIVTPHFGSYSQEAFRELEDKVRQAAIAVLQGRFPESIVNPEAKSKARIVRL